MKKNFIEKLQQIAYWVGIGATLLRTAIDLLKNHAPTRTVKPPHPVEPLNTQPY